jgi:hypothetical protein
MTMRRVLAALAAFLFGGMPVLAACTASAPAPTPGPSEPSTPLPADEHVTLPAIDECVLTGPDTWRDARDVNRSIDLPAGFPVYRTDGPIVVLTTSAEGLLDGGRIGCSRAPNRPLPDVPKRVEICEPLLGFGLGDASTATLPVGTVRAGAVVTPVVGGWIADGTYEVVVEVRDGSVLVDGQPTDLDLQLPFALKRAVCPRAHT